MLCFSGQQQLDTGVVFSRGMGLIKNFARHNFVLALSLLQSIRSGFPRMIVFLARFISVVLELSESFLTEVFVKISHFRTSNHTHPFASGS